MGVGAMAENAPLLATPPADETAKVEEVTTSVAAAPSIRANGLVSGAWKEGDMLGPPWTVKYKFAGLTVGETAVGVGLAYLIYSVGDTAAYDAKIDIVRQYELGYVFLIPVL